MKDSYFFKHDFNARNDIKMQEVLMELGLEGVGMYWCLIEMLYENDGILPLSSLKSACYMLHADESMATRLIEDFGLFEQDEANFWSESVCRRIGKRNELSGKRAASVNKRWKKDENTNVLQTNNNENTNVLQGEKFCTVDKDKDKDKDKREEEKEENPSPAPEEFKGNVKDIIMAYHELCPSFPIVAVLPAQRAKRIEQCYANEIKGMQVMREIFAKMERSAFLKGKNKRKWVASIDWLFSDGNWSKVLEGQYDDNAAATAATAAITREREAEARRKEEERERSARTAMSREEYLKLRKHEREQATA